MDQFYSMMITWSGPQRWHQTQAGAVLCRAGDDGGNRSRCRLLDALHTFSLHHFTTAPDSVSYVHWLNRASAVVEAEPEARPCIAQVGRGAGHDGRPLS